MLDQLSNELFQHGDMWRALRDMMRQGMQDRSGQQMPGMQRLMEQLRNQRREQLQQYNMDSVMDDLKEKLKEIIQTERQGIDKRLDQAREQTEAWQQIEADGGAEREQYESLYKLLEQRAQSNTEKLDALPGQRRGPDSGTHGVRLHGPRRPADVPRAVGHAPPANGSEHGPTDGPEPAEHVPGTATGHAGHAAGSQPDAPRPDGGPPARLRWLHGEVRPHVRRQPSPEPRTADGDDVPADVADAVDDGQHVP